MPEFSDFTSLVIITLEDMLGNGQRTSRESYHVGPHAELKGTAEGWYLQSVCTQGDLSRPMRIPEGKKKQQTIDFSSHVLNIV